MRLSRTGAFAIGALATLVITSGTSFLKAENPSAINACANKKTGVLRVITKGACIKKTETSISWNQLGPIGATGAKGENGATGAQGPAGQNHHIIDAAGRDLGVALGIYNNGYNADIVFEGGIWTLSNAVFGSDLNVSGTMNARSIFTDSTCSTRLWSSPGGEVAQPLARGAYKDSSTTLYVKPVGKPFLGSSVAAAYSRTGPVTNGIRACVPLTDDQEFQTEYFTAVESVTPPAYTAPFTITSK